MTQNKNPSKKPLVVSQAQVKTVDVLEVDSSKNRDLFYDENVSAPDPGYPGAPWWPGPGIHNS